jgi:hypothetical protein
VVRKKSQSSPQIKNTKLGVDLATRWEMGLGVLCTS